jgi:hypothetical protein
MPVVGLGDGEIFHGQIIEPPTNYRHSQSCDLAGLNGGGNPGRSIFRASDRFPERPDSVQAGMVAVRFGQACIIWGLVGGG